MSTVTETRQKNSKLQELSRNIASSCEQAQSSEASRLGWLLEIAEDCDKFVALLNDELQTESARYVAEKELVLAEANINSLD